MFTGKYATGHGILSHPQCLDDTHFLIAEAFAASRGVTLPSQLRASVRRDGRALLEHFRRLAPHRKPVAIQRWSLRRVALTAWVALIAAALVSIFLENLSDIGLL